MNTPHTVTVYSTPTCPYCVMAKQYLSGKGIDFEDVDVSKDRTRAMEMVSKSGQMGVPVIEINGNITIGFDPETLDKMLAS
jgi:glutaredoxin 3